jgi:hypothetical protein
LKHSWIFGTSYFELCTLGLRALTAYTNRLCRLM